MDIQCQSAVLFVQDIPAARRFYEELLGQQVEVDFGENVGYVGGFAIWQVDHAHRMIFERAAGDSTRLGRNNLELYFETSDLESVETRLEQAGVSFVHPVREQPWCQRALRVYDPDGHIVEIGEPMPLVVKRLLNAGSTVEEIAQRTFMPVEMVRQMAQ